MRDKLKKIIHDARFRVFTEDSLVDYLLENGIILPPKKVYDIRLYKDGMKICEHEVKGVIYDCEYMAFDSRAIGNKIFLTREAAEQALEKGEEDETDT